MATLARLGLSDEELRTLGEQLDAILEHVSRLQAVDTSAVPATAQVGELVNVMRDDEARPSIGAARALANAPAGDGAHFIVGAIQDSDEQ